MSGEIEQPSAGDLYTVGLILSARLLDYYAMAAGRELPAALQRELCAIERVVEWCGKVVKGVRGGLKMSGEPKLGVSVDDDGDILFTFKLSRRAFNHDPEMTRTVCIAMLDTELFIMSAKSRDVVRSLWPLPPLPGVVP